MSVARPDKYAVIDFETVDTFIEKGYGAGWVFALNHGSTGFKILGLGVYLSDSPDELLYLKGRNEIKNLLDTYTNLVMHNGMYDVGCLLFLFPDLDLSKYVIYDTMLLMKFHRQDLMSYSLDSCCKVLKLPHNKDQTELIEFFWNSGIYADLVMGRTKKKIHKRPEDKRIAKLAMSNLDKVPEDIVKRYCENDIIATNYLFKKLLEVVEGYNKDFYSDLLKCTITMKKRGIRIDLKRARYASEYFLDIEQSCYDKITLEFGSYPNINSPKQLAEFSDKVGVSNYDRTDKGNPSLTTEWLEKQENPWLRLIAKAREANKLRTSFVEKLISYQDFNGNSKGDIGILYPTHKIMGAVNTGRFTSGGGPGTLELNIQQIPNPSSEYGKLCRSLFLPDEGEKWISSDFSSQESRLQVHYAALLGSPGAGDIAQMWRDDPHLSFHMKVAELTGLSKSQAKTINLGLSYGMGQKSLCESLGFRTVIKTFKDGTSREVAGPEGLAILKKYHRMLPFMDHLIKTTNSHFSKNGKIKTLSGRYLYQDPKDLRSNMKGLNKLIQGSGADQLMSAMVACYKSGLKVLCVVHDEINISSKNSLDDMEILRYNMENTHYLEVPMLVEMFEGNNWGECK